MPRYFFHVFDDAVLIDDEGLELADAHAARTTALAAARGLMCDQVREGRLRLHHRIEVENERGEAVLSLPFGEAAGIDTRQP
ncbi:MAG TPA: hypothetical protein VF718_00810 [Allosphingosinicella sp.]